MTRTDSIPTLRLRNSLTRRVEDFVPIDPSNVRLYLCGPTVYDRAHLGNARNVILFDLLTRLLRHDYGADAVTYVRNVTDVEDKINERAAETGREIRDITDETLGWFHDDMGALGNLPPDHEPRATDYIGEMVEMIEGLIASGHAYAAEGHVLFSVGSYEGYGKLSGRSLDDMIAGARVEVAPYKRDPMDFVLWKPSADDEPGWETSIGYGRPGWHIECSAMSKALLGPSFDIHGGGNDLMFPHHENERAQSCCADPGAGFARVWLHNEMLLVEGKKMSKSLGNFFTVRDLLDKGVPGEVIRFVFLSTHYSKPMDWTDAKAREAEATLRKWRALTEEGGTPDEAALAHLRDDLNTPGAIAELHRLAKSGEGATLAATAAVLGLLGDDMGAWVGGGDDATVEAILAARLAARADRDWARADALRDALVAAGVVVTDGKGKGWEAGPGFDPAKLEGVL
ncbi:cysteine--tRNA ligase [Jannaschia pohangensis]|uniref:Cysteine--tRNA ligase n=1 Tax=Jannaschia pohangensis TaxID=390807 RepID=A0A1I3GND9_9RHOB|nr:cysteine--tRNA ligase [Jannaschia pohangensis]SFI24995.1 cysteinyl-tRNA synthetase [Jannaschia pohangensis]